MSRTGLDPADIARQLRRMAGDGSVEWVMEPMQASGLLDIADWLDENAELRGLASVTYSPDEVSEIIAENDRLREYASELWDMFTCNVALTRCAEVCDHAGECMTAGDDGVMRCWFDRRRRELGVEVDDA